MPDPVGDADTSSVAAVPESVSADGVAYSTITVIVRDVDNNPLSGKTVTLAASGGGSIISGASGVSDVDGIVTFTVTDENPEIVTYTATIVEAGTGRVILSLVDGSSEMVVTFNNDTELWEFVSTPPQSASALAGQLMYLGGDRVGYREVDGESGAVSSGVLHISEDLGATWGSASTVPDVDGDSYPNFRWVDADETGTNLIGAWVFPLSDEYAAFYRSTDGVTWTVITSGFSESMVSDFRYGGTINDLPTTAVALHSIASVYAYAYTFYLPGGGSNFVSSDDGDVPAADYQNMVLWNVSGTSYLFATAGTGTSLIQKCTPGEFGTPYTVVYNSGTNRGRPIGLARGTGDIFFSAWEDGTVLRSSFGGTAWATGLTLPESLTGYAMTYDAATDILWFAGVNGSDEIKVIKWESALTTSATGVDITANLADLFADPVGIIRPGFRGFISCSAAAGGPSSDGTCVIVSIHRGDTSSRFSQFDNDNVFSTLGEFPSGGFGLADPYRLIKRDSNLAAIEYSEAFPNDFKIYRSSDGGYTWDYTGKRGFVHDFSLSGKHWLIDYDGEIFVSLYEGGYASKGTISYAPTDITCHPGNPAKVAYVEATYAGTDFIVTVTLDGGATWNTGATITGGDSGFNQQATLQWGTDNRLILFYSNGTDLKIVVSDDYGATWTEKYTSADAMPTGGGSSGRFPAAIVRGCDGCLFALKSWVSGSVSVTTGVLLRSLNNGNTWTAMNTTLPYSEALAYNTNNDKLYVAYLGSATIDFIENASGAGFGGSWSSIAFPDGDFLPELRCLAGCNCDVADPDVGVPCVPTIGNWTPHWDSPVSGTPGTSNIAVEPTDTHGGAYTVHWTYHHDPTHPSYVLAIFYQCNDFIPNGRYRLSFWYKGMTETLDRTPFGDPNISRVAVVADGEISSTTTTDLFNFPSSDTVVTDWTQVTMTFTASNALRTPIATSPETFTVGDESNSYHIAFYALNFTGETVNTDCLLSDFTFTYLGQA